MKYLEESYNQLVELKGWIAAGRVAQQPGNPHIDLQLPAKRRPSISCPSAQREAGATFAGSDE